ncbi:ketoacyl-ACP synthase III [Solwaraspora sp. WMMD791]|uniref:beta-ketoacyl-ACP synthase III n=1 Tax=Solwaraspora sp. WMMD791 TaxID=3016086 RepID=UPI00249CA5BD|nr:beta-ketoacyl-ACP synthase III [Solwaraspora sp. WMMD791]WFE28848.1 ketoacyl-ACP synthase III [Solwaraspora sp. WMMD791]
MSTRIRTATGTRHTRILGVGAYRPARVVTNHEIASRIDSSDEWISSRTGIRTRRWAGPDETLTEMGAAAAGKAIAHAGLSPGQIDAVLVATITHFKQTPAAATTIGHRVGADAAMALDISAACAGFSTALALASDLVRAGSAGHVLVIGVERLSDLLNHDDRGTAFLFGDGAGAVVVGPAETPGIGPVAWGADGSQSDIITQSVSWQELRHDREVTFPFVQMEGQAVYRWASRAVAQVARTALDLAGITGGQLDAFIPHQANLRITDALVKALDLPTSVAVARDIVDAGNTSAASIPLAMDQMLASGEVNSGDTALLLGFGAGLAYASQVVTLP